MRENNCGVAQHVFITVTWNPVQLTLVNGTKFNYWLLMKALKSTFQASRAWTMTVILQSAISLGAATCTMDWETFPLIKKIRIGKRREPTYSFQCGNFLFFICMWRALHYCNVVVIELLALTRKECVAFVLDITAGSCQSSGQARKTQLCIFNICCPKIMWGDPCDSENIGCVSAPLWTALF